MESRVNFPVAMSPVPASMLIFSFGQTIHRLAMYFGRLECFDSYDLSDKVDGM